MRAFWDRFRGWIAVALAGSAVAGAGVMGFTSGGSVDVFVGSTPTPTTVTANLWIDTDGGTCTRQGTAATYSDAAACSTLDAAYTAASAGDRVYICGGGDSATCETGTALYGDQRMDGPAKTSGSQITMQAAPGATVAFRKFDLGGQSTPLDRILFKDFTIKDPDRICAPPGCLDGQNWVIDMSWTTNVDFDNVDVSSNWEGVTTIGVSGAVVDTDFTNCQIGETVDAKVFAIGDFNGASSAATNLRIDNCIVGDMAYRNNFFQDIHVECIYYDGPMSGFTISNSIFRYCTSTGMLNWGGTGLMTNVLFSNLVVGQKYGWQNGVDVVPGSKVGYRGDTDSLVIDGANTGGTGVIEYSVIDGGVVLTGLSAFTIRSSIIGNSTCTGGVTYQYVIQPAGNCGTNGSVSSTIFSGSNFVDRAGVDYRPSGSGVFQVGKGDPAQFPATDLLGVARPVGAAPDAGPYEGF